MDLCYRVRQRQACCSSPSDLLGGQVLMDVSSSDLKGILCAEQMSTVGLQMCHHSGFVAPFIEHRWSRFSIILKGLRVFGMISEHWLQLKAIKCVSP